jgi:hypothetical protein
MGTGFTNRLRLAAQKLHHHEGVELCRNLKGGRLPGACSKRLRFDFPWTLARDLQSIGGRRQTMRRNLTLKMQAYETSAHHYYRSPSEGALVL